MYPILLEIGDITLYSLWLFIAIGFVIGSLLFAQLAKRHRLKISWITDGSLWLLTISLITSRLFFIIQNAEAFFTHFSLAKIGSLFAIWDKGLSFWGAVSGLLLGLTVLSRKKNEPLSEWLDLLTISLLAGLFFGHLGAFLDGRNYGIETNLPWGIRFESALVKYSVPVHPTQLYAALYAGGLFSLLFTLNRKWHGRIPGAIFELGITFYSFLRFLEEFLRGEEPFLVFGIRLPHMIALAVFAFGVTRLFLRYTNRNGTDPEGLLRKTITNFLRILTKRTDGPMTIQAPP